MTAAERRHLDRVAALGCCICGRPAAIHHVPPFQRRAGDDRARHRNHRYVIPLCGRHHQTGGYGVAIHAGRVGWANRHGTEAEWLDWVEDRVGVLA